MDAEVGVQGWLREVVAKLRGLEGAVRADAPDAIHSARTQTRRLRVMLPLVPGRPAERALRRLGDYAEVLGRARDLEVRAELAGDLLREVVHGPGGASTQRFDRVETDAAHRYLVGDARRRYRGAHADVVAFLERPRYRKLMAALDDAVEDAASVDPLAVLHEARKSARALRYLAEAYGDDEKAAMGKQVQDVLGQHRDNVLLARSLEGEGEDGVYARLRDVALERAAGLVTDSRHTEPGKAGPAKPEPAPASGGKDQPEG